MWWRGERLGGVWPLWLGAGGVRDWRALQACSFAPLGDTPCLAPAPTSPLRRAPFWQPTSLAMGMFSLPNDRGGATPLLHFSATPLLWVLNAPNYTGGRAARAGEPEWQAWLRGLPMAMQGSVCLRAPPRWTDARTHTPHPMHTLSPPAALMDFVGGNLDEFLHPEKHTAALAAAQGLDLPPAAGAGGKAQAGAAPAPAPPGVPPQTQFNPTMKFGPAPGERPHFRLTIATPRLGVTFEAHPREWTEAAPQHTYVGPGEAPWLRPFLRAQVRDRLFGSSPVRCRCWRLLACSTLMAADAAAWG